MTQVQDNVALTATRSRGRYRADVADAIHGNTRYLLQTIGEDPRARALACVAVLTEVATSTVARNAAREEVADG